MENLLKALPKTCHYCRSLQIYGAIAFYLANRELVDAYLKEGEAEFEKLQQSFREKNPLLYQKLKTAQMQKQSKV